MKTNRTVEKFRAKVISKRKTKEKSLRRFRVGKIQKCREKITQNLSNSIGRTFGDL